jgi:hypothetical protein
MSELLQEFVDSASQQLRVNHDAGVIRGVKLLGLDSRNGRRYRENALIEAIGLYEGAKVNINHPKGHPLSPRDYQDRLGVVRGVQFRAGAGLFGDLHFNPRHALSEQLVWDAEHAPQNVGMSHNVLARTKQEGSGTIVEAITKVQSIDLVADPATTNGLYEQIGGLEKSGPGNECSTPDSNSITIETITLEQLRRERPEIICEIENAYESQLDQVRRRLDEMVAKDEMSRRRERMLQLLQEFDLPLPESRDAGARRIVSDEFLDSLMRAPNDVELRSLIESRATLVRSASQWSGGRPSRDRRPKSKDQLTVAAVAGRNVRTAAEFAAAVCPR